MKTEEILKLIDAGFTKDEILKMEEPEHTEQPEQPEQPETVEQPEQAEPVQVEQPVNIQSQVDKAVADAMNKFNNMFDEMKNNLGLFTPMPIVEDKETLESIGASIVAPKSRTKKGK